MNIDTTTGLPLQIKRPSELCPFTFEFSSLVDGEVIASISSVTQIKRGDVALSADVSITTLSHDAGVNAQAWIGGGTDGEYYCLTCEVITSIGATRTCSGVLLVKGAC